MCTFGLSLHVLSLLLYKYIVTVRNFIRYGTYEYIHMYPQNGGSELCSICQGLKVHFVLRANAQNMEKTTHVE